MKSTPHFHFDVVDSTNNWAKENLDRLAPEGVTLITADHQTAGRGRLNRRWLAPKGENLYATFCFFSKNDCYDFAPFTQIAALAAAQVLESHGVAPFIKWPNDLLIGEKKICGILTEAVYAKEKKCLIIGVGLNLNMPASTLETLGRPATSLLVETGRPQCIGLTCQALDKAFNQLLNHFFKEGFSQIFPLYAKRFKHKPGDPIAFNGNQKGIFHQLLADGSIEILSENGFQRFISGELV